MLRLFLAICLPSVSFAAALPVEPELRAATPIGDDKPIKALDAWLKLYHAGKIDYASRIDMARSSVAVKFGISGELKKCTWQQDLDMILEAVARIGDADAAEALLAVAVVGIEPGKYKHDMAPHSVRAAGERAIASLTSAAAKEQICKAARGELKVGKARMAAYRAAAAKALGVIGDGTLLSTIEPLLNDPDELVRANAAEAFGKLGRPEFAASLVALVQRETSDPVLMTAANALQSVFKPLTGETKAAPANGGAAADAGLPETVRGAVRACIDALGRATWRADMAIVRFLDDFRTAEAVPALIVLLERFRDHPEELKSGRLSGLLQFQVHELLVSMTGAVFPADQPDKWRQFWEAEKDRIQVTEKHTPQSGGNTVAGDFFGIPIEGTRVVFILDLSGSMDWKLRGHQGEGTKGPRTGLDFLKQELRRVVTSLPPNSQFNLITFNGNPKPDLWNKDLVPATDKNRDRVLKYIDGLDADGGTNLWCALEEALKVKSLVHTSRYETTVDELFVLSDGAPSVGEVIDPQQILRLVKETNRFASLRINTVFVHTEPPSVEFRQQVDELSMLPEELMKRLAEENGGTFREL